MPKNEFAPVTPGEMLKEEFPTEYGLSQNRLAKAVGISPNRIAEIVNNRRRITAETLARTLDRIRYRIPLSNRNSNSPLSEIRSNKLGTWT
jgi:addiction module HigA family antidote